MAMNINKNAICGMKITIPPTPAKIPSTNKSFNTPAGKASLATSLMLAKVSSIKFMGNSANVKIAWKIKNKMKSKTEENDGQISMLDD